MGGKPKMFGPAGVPTPYQPHKQATKRKIGVAVKKAYAASDRDALIQRVAQLTKERDDLVHICEVQRVALESLRKQLDLKSRGTEGFGSTGSG